MRTITIVSSSFKGQPVLVGSDDDGNTIGPVPYDGPITATSDGWRIACKLLNDAGVLGKLTAVDHDGEFVHATIE